MTKANSEESGKGPLSLLLWGALAAVLAGGAYLIGAEMARHWVAPPPPSTFSTATEPPEQTASAAAWLRLGAPVESTLGAEDRDEWQFQGRAGQSATIEMWFHPGSGSNVDAELAVHLIAPDGTMLASEIGSGFLPPYVVASNLPETGFYRVQVAPTSGEPGRYSLALTLAETAAVGTPGALPTLRPPLPTDGSQVAISLVQFQWPTPRREISGWTFHDPGNPGHIGLDIAAEMWDPITAVADGIVSFAGRSGGYGNLVIVEHPGGWSSYYAHLAEFAVEAGQDVRQGELLGGAGSTGYSTGPHLHLELRNQGRPVDPHIYLP